MCRLFGFRSVLKSRVHHSLVSADNALVNQSEQHPDGWGVAYFQQGVPHLVKTADTAVADSLFQRLSGVVRSETVLAHLRKATHGELSMINSHPFQHGNWCFAHNGGIPGFEDYRDELTAQIDPDLRGFILGDTDSEVIFYAILSALRKRVDLDETNPPLEAVKEAFEEVVDFIRAMTGEDCYDGPFEDEGMYLSFILTNGEVMAAHQGGKPLYVSTHKRTCPERDTCDHFAPVCEAPTTSGQVNHLVLASEPLQGENVWRELEPRQIIGVNAKMELGTFNTPEGFEVREPETAAAG
jgi:glutamine amidotransferase